MLDCSTCTGSLAIDGQSMHTEAWCMLDLAELWLDVPYRGGVKVLPRVAGWLTYPTRRAGAEHSLPMAIIGERDPNGVLYDVPATVGSVWEGLELNLQLLEAAVVHPVTTGDGTQPATLTMPSGTVRTADVQVLGITPGQRFAGTGSDGIYGCGMLATLELRIKSGRFT